MTKRTSILAAISLLLPALGIYAIHRTAWDWQAMRLELRALSWPHVGLAVLCILLSVALRSPRWAILMRRQQSLPAFALLAPQAIGFSAVALFGRIADLARPTLIARRTRTAVTTQIALYSVERIFDLAAAAFLFSSTLAFAPHAIPHHEAIVRAGVIASTLTVLLTLIALAVRFAGDTFADRAGRALQPLSPAAATFVAARIRDLHAGLDTLRDLPSFLATAALSLVIWCAIAEAYIQTAHAFRATPQLAALTFTQTMLLMATSMGSSLVQVPILGWFTQIGLVATALHTLLDVPVPAALACAAILLCVTTLSIVPFGLITAHREGLTLRTAATC